MFGDPGMVIHRTVLAACLILGIVAIACSPSSGPAIPDICERWASGVPGEISFQLTYEPTHGPWWRYQPDGNVPILTLFASGRAVFYRGDRGAEEVIPTLRLYEATLSKGELLGLCSELVSTGIGNAPDRIPEASDAGVDYDWSIVRMLDETGKLLEKREYTGNAARLPAMTAVESRLDEYSNSDERPYSALIGKLFANRSDCTGPHERWPVPEELPELSETYGEWTTQTIGERTLSRLLPDGALMWRPVMYEWNGACFGGIVVPMVTDSRGQ